MISAMAKAPEAKQVQVEEHIAASPDELYAMVSDVTNMGRWSPETRSCRWLKGATGPAVGARFRGANRSGWRRWSTTCTIVAADPGRRFSFEVGVGPVSVARWTYDFEPDGAGTKVTETWDDRRAPIFARVTRVAMGVPDRAEHNRQGMAATLRALKAAAES
jgi:uncharacterized protein YndB with AHSA1/START domain